MTNISKIMLNNLAPFEKTRFVTGSGKRLSRDTYDHFYKKSIWSFTTDDTSVDPFASLKQYIYSMWGVC